MNTENVVEESTLETHIPKKSNGQLFKEKNGYSKTIKRLMNKYNCSSPEKYRDMKKGIKNSK